MKLRQEIYACSEFLTHLTKCLLLYATQFRMICSVAIVSEIDFDTWMWGAAKIKPKTFSIDFGTGWLVKTYKALRRFLVRD